MKTIDMLLVKERLRQDRSVNLIASENYTSDAVMRVVGSCLTNKYAEGRPGRRFYAGCEVVDEVEAHATELAKKIFGVEHANVQPHSGSNANLAVFLAALKQGDTILSMSMDAGGHLTHGYKKNISSMLFNVVSYGVDKKTECIDYDEVAQLAKLHKPKLIVAGASSYSREIDFAVFGVIAKSVGALLLADIAHIAGLVATGLHQSPVPHADFITATTHKTLRGPRGGLAMCRAEFASALDRAVMPGTQGGPLMNVIAGKAVAFEEVLTNEFRDYQKQVVSNARAMANKFVELGFRVVSGGTDNHMFLL
ncbi:serine hydroxymethyltransferase, partial [bacterium]|nr:serine hydroxymethyltransferase [bacterium]